jgi:hypothetical protein
MMANSSARGLLLPGAVLLGMAAALLQLWWEHAHGGILRHHLLNDPGLPAISNAWGIVVLPVLGTVAGWALTRRSGTRAAAVGPALAGFVGALCAGAALSVAFVTGGESVATQVMVGILAASVVFPTYRAEYLFGFVLGMTCVFGPVLPALVATVPMLMSLVSRQVVWRGAMWVLRRPRAGAAG